MRMSKTASLIDPLSAWTKFWPVPRPTRTVLRVQTSAPLRSNLPPTLAKRRSQRKTRKAAQKYSVMVDSETGTSSRLSMNDRLSEAVKWTDLLKGK